jgi:lipopolysaccharide export LptBFGC system permease protein LptF
VKKGAIIVGMWAKKARALVAPDLICLTSVNLAINSIDYLAYYRYIGDSSKTQLNVWLASINATVCFLALLVFLLSYLFPSKAKLLRIIGIAMLTEISLGYLAAGIIDFSTGYSIDGAWDLAIWCIWVGMVFGPLYRECEREKEAPTIA